jgi:hypothetical protein
MNSVSERRRRQASPRAVARARELTEALCIDEREQIDAELIAYERQVVIHRKPLFGELGRLVRKGPRGKALIVVREGLRPERERFVILHEVGHLELHPDLDQFKACSAGDMTAYYGDGREPEANQFAAEMLMPRKLFEPYCDVRQPSLEHVRRLADLFRTSQMSTGIRFAAYCPEPCAFVYSRSGKIMWSSQSDSFPFYLKKGWELPQGDDGNYAGDFHAGLGQPPERPTPLDAETWTDSRAAKDRSVYEHSRGWTEAGGVTGALTLLWLKE